MTPNHLIGLTTTGGWFRFGQPRPEPLFPEPLPDHGLVFIAEKLVPQNLPADRYSIIPVEVFDRYVAELKAPFDTWRAQITTNSIRYRLRNEIKASAEQRALNPDQTARMDTVLGSMWTAFRITPGLSISIEERVYQAVSRILDEPLANEDFKLPVPAGEHLDRGKIWPGKEEPGFPRYLPMAQLITDVHIAGKEGLTLLTNDATRTMLPKAERFLEHLLRNDLVGYLTE